MEQIPAILEKYADSFRVTPERPTKKTKGVTSHFKKVKAELFHWEESDAMDIFIIPPRNPAAASTRVVKRFPWGGSITRSIYGKYRISIPFDDDHGNPLSLAHIKAYAAEAQRWISDDRKTFNPQPEPEKKRNHKS